MGVEVNSDIRLDPATAPFATSICEQRDALTDEHLATQVLAGHAALFEVLMRGCHERVYRVARSIVRDDDEAEDVMQQTYVSAYANFRQFHGKAQFSTWLTRIAINEALARVRRRAKYELYDDDLSTAETLRCEQSYADPERQAYAGELHELLECAIDGLPNASREVFVLRDVEGSSTAETAQSLNLSEDVVKTRLSRARAALRRALMDRQFVRKPLERHLDANTILSRCNRRCILKRASCSAPSVARRRRE